MRFGKQQGRFGDSDTSSFRQALVDRLKTDGVLTQDRVEAAFRAVPRHVFLPDVPPDDAYRDIAIATKRIDGIPVSSSSQPAIMAIMLEQLDLRPGHRVLEIGAGTGYNAALMAHIVGSDGNVITVDIDDEVAMGAERHLHEAGMDSVRVVHADGGLGFAQDAPYDRIMVTVGAPDVLPAWWEQLSASHGRLVLPLSLGEAQESIAFERMNDHLTSRSLYDCGFMRLRGQFAGAESVVRLDADAPLFLATGAGITIDSQSVYSLLQGPFHDSPIGVQAHPQDVWGSLRLWLELHESRGCAVSAEGDASEWNIVPPLLRSPGTDARIMSCGLVGDDSIHLLTYGDDSSSDHSLFVRSFGHDDGLVARLSRQVIDWNAAGRPASNRLHVEVYRPGAAPGLTANRVRIVNVWTELVLSWT